MDTRKQVDIVYTDQKGEKFARRIEPVHGFGEFNYSASNSAPEWLMKAIDVSGDGTIKLFTMARVESWRPLPIGSSRPMPVHPRLKS